MSLPNQPEEVDEDKMYKDLNHLFYKKDMENDFLTFKKGIKQIESHISNRPHTFPSLNDPSLETIEQNSRKVIGFISKNGDKFLRKHFLVESMIIKDTNTNNTLYKIYSLPDNSPHVEQLKCIFINEVYYQLKASKVASKRSDFIVPDLKDFFFHQNYGLFYCVFEMEFVEMTRISEVLNPSNSKTLFDKMEYIISDLNADKIFHNDLKPDNIGVNSNDHSKIVLIDFGEASCQATNNSSGPNYLFFDRQFSEKTEKFDYNALVQWATENHRYKLLNEDDKEVSNRKRNHPQSNSHSRSQSHMTVRSRGRSRSRSRSRSSGRDSHKNKTARRRSNTITNTTTNKKPRGTSRGRSLPRNYTYSPRENNHNKTNKVIDNNVYNTL
jgi:tRNA A-37 threonylcarbamoyl transferase component Bud32